MTTRVADQRALRGTAVTLSWQNVDSDGEAAAPAGVVTVRVQKADGTDVKAAGTATGGVGADPRTATLTAAETATLNLFTVTWTDAGDGSAHTTYVEIVGGFYFSVAELRAFDANLTEAKHPNARVLAARRHVEDEFETICDVAFVPRYKRVTIDGTGRPVDVSLGRMVRSIRTVRTYSDVSNGTFTAYTATELADLVFTDGGVLRHSSGVSLHSGVGNIIAEVEHGYDRPPADVKEAAMWRARNLLNARTSGFPDRARTVSVEGTTYGLAGPAADKTGVDFVDAVLARYKRPVVLVG